MEEYNDMLKLKNIVKTYISGDSKVEALKGIDLEFRKNEFVSILGPSGCGKTTLLNIIGGLDRYTSGDLFINGVSTKEYGDRDWDAYRNHSIGFVFQSYNLIPHQTVLSNVELALTISGVPKSERKKRAKEALEKVGLGDQLKKRPNQLSGGQMQRVAIARALVNDPEILLADEPTGALDSDTSIQVMEILKEISKDKLIIMVTHNPELAEKYSTRIVRLLDGSLKADTDPYSSGETAKPEKKKKQKKTSMSFFTAVSLSLNNLMTKKTRTFMTAFAGSIGIIGIALILAISNGIQGYINAVQEDTLSSYPVVLRAETVDAASLFTTMLEAHSGEVDHELDKIYASTMMSDMMNSMLKVETNKNNLKAFKEYLESGKSDIKDHINSIQYGYKAPISVYSADTTDGVYRVNPSDTLNDMMKAMYSENSISMMSSMMGSSMFDTWCEILPGKDGQPINELLNSQYDMLKGRWPSNYDEVVLIADKNNEINDVYLYSLGMKDPDEMTKMMETIMRGEEYKTESLSWTYDDLLGMTFKLVLNPELYEKDPVSGIWKDMSESDIYMKTKVNNGLTLKVVGIIRPNKDAASTALQGVVGYTNSLTKYVIDKVNTYEIVKEQQADPTLDVITGLPFKTGDEKELTPQEKAAVFALYAATLSENDKSGFYLEYASVPHGEQLNALVAQQMANYPDAAAKDALLTQLFSANGEMSEETVTAYIKTLHEQGDEIFDRAFNEIITQTVIAAYTEQVKPRLEAMSRQQLAEEFDKLIMLNDEATLIELYDAFMPASYSESTYDENIALLGVADLTSPETISIYAATFEDKDAIAKIIKTYNNGVDDTDKINYTDYVALIMSSITTIINAISYVLIAFVSISLVVSSIMISIITYISVLERTKEIGILRAVGASKKDISRVFNAETVLEGFASGIVGIVFTMLLCLPINAIIRALTDINSITAALPPIAAIVLVAISVALTMLAGFIPAKMAAKKDPVTALRTE